MRAIQRAGHFALTTATALVMLSCSGQKEPAGKLVGDVDATVIAASSEASKYVPDQLADVQGKLVALKAAYDKQDYAQVMASGPQVLVAASDLATAAAAQKDAILKALDDEWTALAAALPNDVTAIQNRIDLLGMKSGKKLAAGIDLDAAKSGLSDASSLWSKAQAAFASGNLDEAVRTAKAVKEKLVTLAAAVKVALVEPPATA